MHTCKSELLTVLNSVLWHLFTAISNSIIQLKKNVPKQWQRKWEQMLSSISINYHNSAERLFNKLKYTWKRIKISIWLQLKTAWEYYHSCNSKVTFGWQWLHLPEQWGRVPLQWLSSWHTLVEFPMSLRPAVQE